MATYRDLCRQITAALPALRAAAAADPSGVFVRLTSATGEVRGFTAAELVAGYTSSASTCMTVRDDTVEASAHFATATRTVLDELRRRNPAQVTPTVPQPGDRPPPAPPTPIYIPPARSPYVPWLVGALGLGLGLAVAWAFR